ncbi:MAG: GH3 auxin-responsive promoter family protein, partial [Gammaproteobacteria bacterium]
MSAPDPRQMLEAMLAPWHAAVADPVTAQQAVLGQLLPRYTRTEYGKEHGAGQISDLAGYRAAFPVKTYDEFKPLIDRVMKGEIELLLDEEPLGWAITRGTTAGESKFIPMTPTDMAMRVSAGRAMMNYVME